MATELTADAEFDRFFDDLAKLNPNDPVPATYGAATAAGDDAAAKAAADAEAAKAAADAKAAEEAAKGATAPVVETPAAGDDAAAKAAADAEAAKVAADAKAAEEAAKGATAPVVRPQPDGNTDLLERLAGLLEKRQDTRAPGTTQTPTAVPLYSDAELAEIATAEKDWPDIMRVVGLILRGTMLQNNSHIFQEVAKVIGPQGETLATVADMQHRSDLHRAIPDYDAVKNPVIAWARDDKLHPSYLRDAFEHVIQTGDVDEISDLVNRWRKETGQPTPQASGQPAPRQSAPAKSANELSAAAKQAAAALAPVVSQRTAQVPSEPVGFDDAFKTYAEQLDDPKRS